MKVKLSISKLARNINPHAHCKYLLIMLFQPLAIREDRTRGGRSTYQCSYTLPAGLTSNANGGMPPNISLPTLPLPLKMEDEEDGERVPSSQSNDPTQSSSTSGLGEDLQTDLTNTTITNASTVPLLIQVRFQIIRNTIL